VTKLIVLALPLAVACACEGGAAADPPSERLHYFRDERTSLCFAYGWWGMGNGGPGLASVPCSPDVVRLLERRPFGIWSKP